MGNTVAAQNNLKKAQLARSIQFKKRKFIEFDKSLKHLEGKIDLEIEKQVKEQLKAVDRKFAKEEFFRVFEDVGGRKGLAKWIKESSANRKAYYTMYAQLLKAETESGGTSGGVKVSFMFGGDKKSAIDVTPGKENDILSINIQDEPAK